MQDVKIVIKGLQSITGKCSCSNAALQAVFNCSVPVGHNAGVSKLTVQLAINFANAEGGKTATKHKLCANTCILHFAHSHLLLSDLVCQYTAQRVSPSGLHLAFGIRICLVASA